ncbi:MAG: hypothetical protein F6K56_03525 [Moorea sp. SIO3G5]|nr:hypothetical protein [Moorena sp. SIO3G5]
MTNYIKLSTISTFETGIFDDGAAEIPAYDTSSQRLFVVNGANNAIDVLNLSDPANPTKITEISLNDFGGGTNSVAVNNGIVAVAVEDENTQNPGQVVFFNTDGNFLNSVTVGALPDALTFTADGQKVLVANEGEPNNEFTVDPEGSVSIIDISGGVKQATVTNADFKAFNPQIDQLQEQGVRIFGPGATVAQDLEPEFITVSEDSQTAWITLQENNALAVLDINRGEITDILPLGFKDHSLPGNGFDASDQDDGINIQNLPVFGMFQPDAIASFQVDGKTFLITANEGDSRDFEGFSEEALVGDLKLDPHAFPDAAELQKAENLGSLIVTNTLGDTDGDGDFDQLFAFGSRSFSIWDEYGNQVFDSGDDFERITAEFLPDDFNSDNDANDSFDTRSNDKGPEPEGVVTGVIDGRTFAFIGLERIGGIMVYDVSEPTHPTFVQYINNRDFSGDAAAGTAGDLGPEGLTFISAEDSPNGRPLLVAANEVSGTTTIYEIESILPDQSIVGDEGDNKLVGTEEDDIIKGLEGNDTIHGDRGDDLIQGNQGDDKLKGGRGHDDLDGGSGNDTIRGGRGRDDFDGGLDNDFLQGGRGNDILDGNHGDDTIKGGRHDDILDGGSGDDILNGGRGSDVMTGGQGYDHFIFKENKSLLPGEFDVIKDFEVGVDKIEFHGWGNIDPQEWLNSVIYEGRITNTEDGTLFQANDGGKVLIEGVSVEDLSGSDFSFS